MAVVISPGEASLRGPRASLLGVAAAGFLVAALLAFAPSLSELVTYRVLALGMLTVVPLALAVMPPAGPTFAALLRIMAFVHPVAALLAAGALLRPAGLAGPFTSLWAGFSLLLLSGAFFHFFGAPRRGLDTLGGASVFLLLGLAGLAFVAHRASIRVFGLDSLDLLLSIIHGHFAVVAPVLLAVRAARTLEGTLRTLALGAIVLAWVSLPLVGIGRIVSPELALVGAVAASVGLSITAALNLGAVLRRLQSRLARGLLAIASLGALVSMPLAVWRAWAATQGAEEGLGTMVVVHGLTNALAVTIAGLLAWAIEDRHGAR